MDNRGRVSHQASVEQSAHCTEGNEDSGVKTVTDREKSHQEDYVEFRDNNRVDNYPPKLCRCQERNGYSQAQESQRYPERRELHRRESPKPLPESQPNRRESPKHLPESQPKRSSVDPFKRMRHSIVLRSDYVRDNLSQFSHTHGMKLSPEHRQASGHSGCDPCDFRKSRKQKEPPYGRQQTCCDPKTRNRDGSQSHHSCHSCYDTPPPPKKPPKKKTSCESCCAARQKPRSQPSSDCCCAPSKPKKKVSCEECCGTRSRPRSQPSSECCCSAPPPKPKKKVSCEECCSTRSKPRAQPSSDCCCAPSKPKKKVSCEECCASRSKPRSQPSSDCCCSAPPSNSRRESRDKNYCEEPPPRPRRESKQCDFYSETAASSRRETPSRPRRESQATSTAGCACVRPAPTQPRKRPSQCSCSKKIKQKGYAPSLCNSDYTEFREFKPPICRNPLVVRSKVCVPPSFKQRPSSSCPAYKKLPPSVEVICECGPSKQSQPKPKPQPCPPPPRPTVEYCTNSAPTDYLEKQPSSGLFTRNSLTVSSSNVKINCCPKRKKSPVSNETLNERKMKSERYCNPPRPKCPAQQPPRPIEPLRKCKRCNKAQVRPKRAMSIQFQESRSRVETTCYVPATCFAPTLCPPKRKRNTEARRGRSCSGFTVKPTNSIHRTRRMLNNKLQSAAHDTQALCGIRPMVSARRSILKVRLSGCGLNQVGSKMLMGSGYKMIPFPALTRLSMNRRMPKLNPSTYIYPRCRGGKLTPTTTKVHKTRQTNSQRLNSANSLATARTSPRRVTESRRDRLQPQGHGQVPTASYGSARTPQSTARRDLPQRYQTASAASKRPVQVTEEASHPVPRRSHSAGPAPQMTRRQSEAQGMTKPVSNRTQEVERAPVATASRAHAVKKSVSIRLKEPSSHPEDKGHAFPNKKAQDEERASVQSQSRSKSGKVSEAERHSQNQSSPRRVQEEAEGPSQNQTVASRVQERAGRPSQNPIVFRRKQEDQEEAERPSLNQTVSSRVQEGAERPSQRQSVHGRVQESGRSSPQIPLQGSSRSGSNRIQEAGHSKAGLAVPNRDQEGGRPPVQAQSRTPAFINKVQEEARPSGRNQSRGPTVSQPASRQITEKPQSSTSARNQPEKALEDDNHQFYRGSFLTIRSPMPNERPTQPSTRPHGSLIMIAQNGLQPQILKRSIPKGSSFIVPNKWQCMGKMNGFIGINSFMDIGKSGTPQRRHSWNWRKLCPNWLLNSKSRTTRASDPVPVKMSKQ